MKSLPKVKFALAWRYLEKSARPLELSLFNYYYREAHRVSVVSQLVKYVNPGGFGHALEPDMRSPSSSALATDFGLKILVELDLPSKHPMVRDAVSYLFQSLDQKTKTWRVAPTDVNNYPHAPWWHDEGGSLAKTFDDYLVIPRAGILASLCHYHDLLPAWWLDDMINATIKEISGMDSEQFGGGGDTLVYTRRLAETELLPFPTKYVLITRVRKLADSVVTRNPNKWSEYCAPPLKLAPTPESITAGVLADCIPAHLDYFIENQDAEGFWDVTWTWADYPEDWETAKVEWRGVLTLEVLKYLESFGRLGI